jgi:hypothetical protein
LANRDKTQTVWFGKKHDEFTKQQLREWHMNRPKEWSDNVSAAVKKSYENNEDLRRLRSEQMKDTWDKNKKRMTETARINGKHNQFGKLNHNSIEIEYKGTIYYGWRELQENTSVTKHLYKKYYLNGVDPEPRIGKDGPAVGTIIRRKEGSV